MHTRAACDDTRHITPKQREEHVKRAVDAFLRTYPLVTERSFS